MLTKPLYDLSVLVIKGPMLCTWDLRNSLEEEGATVTICHIGEAAAMLRAAPRHGVLIDFALGGLADTLSADLEQSGIAHISCSAPSREQPVAARALAADSVAAALADLINRDRQHDKPRKNRPLLGRTLHAL